MDHEEEAEFWCMDMKSLRKNGDSTIDFHCLQTSLKPVKILIGNLASTNAQISSVNESIFCLNFIQLHF